MVNATENATEICINTNALRTITQLETNFY
jgi:hypothetical protein